jgi:hypothetical protein
MTTPLLSTPRVVALVRNPENPGPVPAVTRRIPAHMTFEQALDAWDAAAPPMTPARWAQLRPLLDRAAAAQVTSQPVSRRAGTSAS